MPTTPNDKQVGGDHYAKHGKFQHWDVVALYNIPYLPATATKYLWRWKDKNGVQDLKKAAHYIEKMLSVYPSQKVSVTIPVQVLASYAQMFRWDIATENVICTLLQLETSGNSLNVALHLLNQLIAVEENPHRKAMLEQTKSWSNPLHYDDDQPTAAQIHPG